MKNNFDNKTKKWSRDQTTVEDLKEYFTSSLKLGKRYIHAIVDTDCFKGNIYQIPLDQIFVLEIQKLKVLRNTQIIINHELEHMEFSFPIKGQLELEGNGKHICIDGKRDLLTSVHFQKINSEIHIPHEQEIELVSINIDCEYMKRQAPDFLQHLTKNKSGFFKVHGIDSNISKTIKKIQAIDVNHLERLDLAEMCFDVIFQSDCIINGNRSYYRCLSAEDFHQINEIKRFIDRYFYKELSLKNLSQLGRINEFKLKRGFKEYIGTTVFEYIRQKRLDYAEKLLQTEAYTFEEIAMRCGYQSYPSFFKAFKERFKCSPTSYHNNRIQ